MALVSTFQTFFSDQIEILSTIFRESLSAKSVQRGCDGNVEHDAERGVLNPAGKNRTGPERQTPPKDRAAQTAERFGEGVPVVEHCRGKSLNQNGGGDAVPRGEPFQKEPAEHELPAEIVAQRVNDKVQREERFRQDRGQRVQRVNLGVFYRVRKRHENDHQRRK